MADQTGTVQNRGMLIVAIVLAVVVAIAFNVFVEAVKNEKAKTVRVLRYTRTLSAGQRIEKDDVEVMEVTVASYDTFGTLVLAEDADIRVIGKPVVRKVNSDKPVLLTDVGGGVGESVDGVINDGMVAVAVEVGREASPGQILTPEGRINLIAPFSIAGKVKYYPIIENVRVLGVAGSASSMSGDSRRAPTTYRTVTVELTPLVHRQLLSVLSHKRGPVMIEVVNRENVADTSVQISRDLVKAGLTEGMGSDSSRGTREVSGGNMDM
jgi:Flp pilus assembly protein CpaB